MCKAFYLLSDYICTLCSKYPEHFFCLYTNLSTPVRRLTPMQSSPKYRAEGPGSGNITREITMQNYAKLRCRVTSLVKDNIKHYIFPSVNILIDHIFHSENHFQYSVPGIKKRLNGDDFFLFFMLKMSINMSKWHIVTG